MKRDVVCKDTLEVASDYPAYLLTEHWRLVRKNYIKFRFHGEAPRCELCFSDDGLSLHHLTYLNIGNEHNEDLQMLCRKCHLDEGCKDGSMSPGRPVGSMNNLWYKFSEIATLSEKTEKEAKNDIRKKMFSTSDLKSVVFYIALERPKAGKGLK